MRNGFRLSGGSSSTPFIERAEEYRWVVQPNVKAQQSVHFVLKDDYSFVESPF
jgi:hypothetical protein